MTCGLGHDMCLSEKVQLLPNELYISGMPSCRAGACVDAGLSWHCQLCVFVSLCVSMSVYVSVCVCLCVCVGYIVDLKWLLLSVTSRLSGGDGCCVV